MRKRDLKWLAALAVSGSFVALGWGQEVSRSTPSQTPSLYDTLDKVKIKEDNGRYSLRVSTLHFISQINQAWFIIDSDLVGFAPRGTTYYKIISFEPLEREFEKLGLSAKTAELLVRFMEISQDFTKWGNSHDKSQRQREQWGRPLTPAEEKMRQERMKLERRMLQNLEPAFNRLARQLQSSLTSEQERIFFDWYETQSMRWAKPKRNMGR